MRTKKFFWAVFFVTVFVLLILDILLKIWAVDNLQAQPNRILIQGVLGLTYHENSGAFFGFLSNFGGAQYLLAALKTVILAALLWYYHRLPSDKKMWFIRVPLILIFAGGAGNLFDRVSLAYVRDMLEFLFMDFPIFNLADVYVTTGVFALMFVGLFIVKDFPTP
jgi:signal peptidase II